MVTTVGKGKTGSAVSNFAVSLKRNVCEKNNMITDVLNDKHKNATAGFEGEKVLHLFQTATLAANLNRSN